jgi:membrane associated rhomboid family serine protease
MLRERLRSQAMLDDRSYMRAPQRQYWSMTTILLTSLVVCYLIQLILQSQMGMGIARVNELFALSIRGLKEGRWYQLITFQFMHGGFLHILFNMIGLFFFGRVMEEALGPKAMLRLYLLSGTIGGLLQVGLGLVFPVFNAPVVGASAGIFGLIAAFATREPNYPITMLILFVLPVTLLAKWLLLIEAAITVGGIVFAIIQVGGNTAHGAQLVATAHGAHLGGMLTGIAFIKWGSWFQAPWPPWGAAARRRRASRQPVRAAVLQAIRRPRKNVEELPPAEFISREVDPILDKISAHGIHSLTDRERQILEAARSKMVRR